MIGLVAIPAVVALLLAFSLAIAVSASGRRVPEAGLGPAALPVQMSRLAAVCVVNVLVIVNLNMWFAGKGIFFGMGILACVAVVGLAWRITRMECGVAIVMPVVMLSTLLITVWFYGMFGVRGLWLLEGPNHDSLFFFEGAQWALQHPVRVDPAQVNAAWSLGTCRQGAVFIGSDCAVYRGGTYTLLALGSALLPELTPNLALATMAFAALFPMLGMLACIGLGHAGSVRRRCLEVALLVLGGALVMLSPAMVGGIVNGNVATVFGAALVAMSLLLSATPIVPPWQRAAVLGLVAALAGHVYGEAAIYVCWMAAVGVAHDAVRLRRPSWIVAGGCVALACFAIGLNVQLPDLVRSYLEIGKLASGGQWFGYFLTAPAYTWLGSPFSGVLMGGDPPVTMRSVVLGLVLTLATLVAGLRRELRIPTLGLALLTVLLVAFIETRDYAYGEHKVIQLLGPAWTALLLVGLLNAWNRSSARRSAVRVAVVVTFALLLAQTAAFSLRAKSLLVGSIPSHALSQDFPGAFQRIGAGDEVIIDDAGVAGQERFQKTHYVAFMVHLRGARALLPDMGDEVARGGYVHSILSGGFQRSGTPDWLIRIKSDAGTKSVITRADQGGVIQTQEYTLIQLNAVAAEPLVLAGVGWHACESTHCWTTPTFTVEVFVPPACRVGGGNQAAVNFDLDFFSPPPDGTVSVEAGPQSSTVDLAAARQLRVPVGGGWTRITVSSGWPEQSPQSIGLSADGRTLFARINRIWADCGPRG